MATRLTTASALSRQTFAGVTLPGVYGDLLGDVSPDAQVLVYGGEGVGKSTLVLGLAAEWARRIGPVLYVAAEEGPGKTLADRVRRLKATPAGLTFATYDPQAGLRGVLADLRQTGASAVVLDSQTWVDPDSKTFAAFAQVLREAGVMLVTVAHATKAGAYRGNSDVGHAVDAVVHVTRGGKAVATKNRFSGHKAITVPMTAARANPFPSCSCQSCTSCGGVVRSNPAHSGRCAHARGGECECRCGGRMHGSGVTKTRGGLGTSGRQTKQGRAVMASLTEGGTKRVGRSASPTARKPATKKPAAKKPVKRTPTKRTPAPKVAPKQVRKAAPKRTPSGVAAQLASIRKSISRL